MKLKEMLPILPKSLITSGYNFKVNYISSITKYSDESEMLQSTVFSKEYGTVLLSSNGEIDGGHCGNKTITFEKILDSEVEKITNGNCCKGGHYDDMLQIWLSTEEFAEINIRKSYSEVNQEKENKMKNTRSINLNWTEDYNTFGCEKMCRATVELPYIKIIYRAFRKGPKVFAHFICQLPLKDGSTLDNVEGKFSVVDDAIEACQKHFDKFVTDMLFGVLFDSNQKE